VLERIPRRTRDTVQRCILSAAGPKNFDIPKGWYWKHEISTGIRRWRKA